MKTYADTNKPMMANEIISALSDPKKNLHNYLDHKYSRGTVRNLQVQLVQSKKFFIDDALLYNLVQASMVNPSSFVKALELAKPPYPNMFIEFNETALFKAYRKFYSKHFADLVPFIDKRTRFLSTEHEYHKNKHKGYHIYEVEKDNDYSYAYIPWTQVTSKFPEFQEHYGKWCVSPLGFSISNLPDSIINFKVRQKMVENQIKDVRDNNIPSPAKYRFFQKLSDGSDQITFPAISYFGEDYFHYYSQRFAKGVDQRLKDNPNIIYGQHDFRGKGYNKSICHKVICKGDFASIASKIATHESYALQWMVDKKFIEENKSFTRLDGPNGGQQKHKNLSIAYDSIKGQARFLVAALSMFNFDHVIYKKRNRETTKVEHIVKGKRVPFNEYSLMTIELPKPRGVKKYEREFSGHGSPKCEHWRCGHWRRFRDRLGNVTRRIWIKAQKLGNKELGTKITDYKLDKAQGE